MKDLYTSLVSRLIFPLHERIKNHSSVALRKETESSQWWGEASDASIELRTPIELSVQIGRNASARALNGYSRGSSSSRLNAIIHGPQVRDANAGSSTSMLGRPGSIFGRAT
jgi:hypothetical protein